MTGHWCNRCCRVTYFQDAEFCQHCGRLIAKTVPVKQAIIESVDRIIITLIGIVAAGLILAIAGVLIYGLIAFAKWCSAHS
jgi:hypothetical protein